MNRVKKSNTNVSRSQKSTTSSKRAISTGKLSALSSLSALPTSSANVSDRTTSPLSQSLRMKSENLHSHHPVTKFAPGLKVNISNIFDARRDFKRETGRLLLRFEIDEHGRNVPDDVIDKAEWADKHLLNEYYQTMLDRFCSSESKKAKQIKPSDRRQTLARKHKKMLNEQRLVMNIRRAIDNTPEYSGFQRHLAQNKKIYGEYNPSQQVQSAKDRQMKEAIENEVGF